MKTIEILRHSTGATYLAEKDENGTVTAVFECGSPVTGRLADTAYEEVTCIIGADIIACVEA